jgi:CspA family cold shock protein
VQQVSRCWIHNLLQMRWQWSRPLRHAWTLNAWAWHTWGPRFSGGGFRIPEPASINGSQQCNKCDATGKLSCRKCAGTGRVDCRKCGGTGVFQRESHSTFQGSSYQARSSESRVTGTVKFYNRDKGFGFISLDGSGEDIHVSSRNLIGVSELRKGDRVSFESRSGDKGSWAASVEKE